MLSKSTKRLSISKSPADWSGNRGGREMGDMYEDAVGTVAKEEKEKDKMGKGRCVACGRRTRKEYQYCNSCMDRLEAGQDIYA